MYQPNRGSVSRGTTSRPCRYVPSLLPLFLFLYPSVLLTFNPLLKLPLSPPSLPPNHVRTLPELSILLQMFRSPSSSFQFKHTHAQASCPLTATIYSYVIHGPPRTPQQRKPTRNGSSTGPLGPPPPNSKFSTPWGTRWSKACWTDSTNA